ncbi:MAG TPA: hypothetical protein VFH51_18415, partial [Myxococcota bacterium]|nr:hypothetical protein [Myxococcota bacterium]
NVSESYKSREFIVKHNNVFRDYTINPNNVLRLARSALAVSDQYVAQGDTLNAMKQALVGFDALALLYSDTVMTNLYGASYGYTTHAVVLNPGAANPNTAVEAYYKITVPSHFGNESALVLNAQLQRFNAVAQSGALVGIPRTVIDTLADITASVAVLSQTVAVIQSANWDLAAARIGNQQLTENIYLSAVTALQKLQQMPANTVYSRYWQVALGVTLANVVNFSLYEGPTALMCMLWGANGDGGISTQGFRGCDDAMFDVAAPNTPYIYDMRGFPPGPGASVDFAAQVAECRYSRMMYALTDGRLTNATQTGGLDLFASSRCLIIQLYNKYYGQTRLIPTDQVIDPNTYGCPANPNVYVQADAFAECTPCALVNAGATAPCAVGGTCDTSCDGVDDNCDGAVDDD